ncbi:MAG: XRE family transcriptional regulator [Candidatus Latescibacteria bacterium]|nr:XRE family transcriptional regulator [Candidatus Latescibacterota bacterium]
MKISKVSPNNRRKAFEVDTRGGRYVFPYAVARPAPTRENGVVSVDVDAEMGREGFVYKLASGDEGAVHIDHVLEYNRDPAYMADMLLYNLTICAWEAIRKSKLSTRELIRRLGTSPAQFYRLLDQTNYRKSMRQLLALLQILDYDVDVVLKSQGRGDGRGGLATGEEIRVSSLSSQAMKRTD